MKTIVHIETTDEERKKLAQALGKSGMASRSDINQAMQAYLKLLLTGADCTSVLEQEKQPPGAARLAEAGGSDPHLNEGRRRFTSAEFRPSRGDEPYIFKAKDEQLHQLHQNLLDALEALENYTWADMEQNRVQKT